MLALIRQDQTNMEKYERGLLRIDPLCVCQDWSTLRVLRIAINPQAAGQVDAAVTFTNFGERTILIYQLVTVAGQWRIHDIHGGIQTSLRQYLTTGLAKEQEEIRALPQ